MYPTYRFFVLVIITLLPVHASAADFDSAYAAYVSGNYHEAYMDFNNLARDRHVEAQYLLGLLHLNGQGVEQSVDKGLGWLKQAAENGSYLAAAELGQIYVAGRGVKVNAYEAAKWIELSTEMASPEDADEECE